MAKKKTKTFWKIYFVPAILLVLIAVYLYIYIKFSDSGKANMLGDMIGPLTTVTIFFLGWSVDTVMRRKERLAAKNDNEEIRGWEKRFFQYKTFINNEPIISIDKFMIKNTKFSFRIEMNDGNRETEISFTMTNCSTNPAENFNVTVPKEQTSEIKIRNGAEWFVGVFKPDEVIGCNFLIKKNDTKTESINVDVSYSDIRGNQIKRRVVLQLYSRENRMAIQEREYSERINQLKKEFECD